MPAPRSELHALVLAAGAARRFGAVKQAVDLDGEPLLLRVVRRAAAAADRTWVILGAHAAQLTPLLTHAPVSVRINPQWRAGLGASIRSGIEHLPPTCDGVMLVLADQVLISAEDFSRLAANWRDAPQSIAAAQYRERSGAPAIFPRRLFAELHRLNADAGARAVLEQHLNEVRPVPMPSAAFDLDTPEDLAALVDSATR
jgi:molybdenum cofactor cytidylyltransferase